MKNSQWIKINDIKINNVKSFDAKSFLNPLEDNQLKEIRGGLSASSCGSCHLPQRPH